MKPNAEVQGSRHDGLKWLVVVILLAIAVIGNAWFTDVAILYRVLGVVAVCAIAAGVALVTTRGKALVELARSAKKEIQRVVWPTRPETIQTTAIVLAAILVVGLMLWAIDTLIGWLMTSVIG
ncbi:preprotein translocase subunit SecE [Halomonas halocynthiae]|uniref:preprotein translocase subunit SecE n=1 Tax=Halomonas halocynthiae TaxID=176290 RepID=UPI000412CEE5|nr:preprotein translocase subunit SecE [Halomonas halocynthiae]